MPGNRYGGKYGNPTNGPDGQMSGSTASGGQHVNVELRQRPDDEPDLRRLGAGWSWPPRPRRCCRKGVRWSILMMPGTVDPV